MQIPIKRFKDGVILPSYQTSGAAAMDLCAALDEAKTLQPNERAIIPTGFAIELPHGYEAQIRARSGLSYKHGIGLANGVGTIDSDYRGEVGVILVNMSSDAFTIEPGMRIAQMVIARYEQVQWNEVMELKVTDRGSEGYGSTSY